MKINKITVSVLLIALLAATPIVVAKQSRTLKQEKAAMTNFNIQSNNSIGKYPFPLTVNSFVKDLGPPDSTFPDTGDEGNTCPTGQLHKWCLKSENFAVSVLGDDYTEKINYEARSRLFLVKKCNYSKPTSFQGLWGIKLGESERSVKAKLEQTIKYKKALNLSLSKSTAISPFGGGAVYQYVLTNGDNLYFFFGIDEQGRLIMIMQAEFDVLNTC